MTKSINPLETSQPSKEGFPKLLCTAPSLYSLWSHRGTGTSKSTARARVENINQVFRRFMHASVSALHISACVSDRRVLACPSWGHGSSAGWAAFWLAASTRATDVGRSTASNRSTDCSWLNRPKAQGEGKKRQRQPDILGLWRCAGQGRAAPAPSPIPSTQVSCCDQVAGNICPGLNKSGLSKSHCRVVGHRFNFQVHSMLSLPSKGQLQL